MVVGLVIGIVIALAFCGAIAGALRAKGKGKVVCALVALALLISFILIPFSFHTVNTGEVAVVKVFGEAQGIRTAGLHYDLWVVKSYEKYDVKVQKMDITTATYSSDAQTMDVDMTVQYQIDPEKVIEITNKFGSLELLQAKIESIVIEKTKAVLSAHKAMDIIADRAAMSPKVEDAVKAAVDENYYVSINTIVLTNIDFSDAFENAVEEKMIAEQQLLKAEYDNKTKVERAEADAEAVLVAAEAEKKANELLQKSLTPEILQEQWIEKWNGETPDVVSGDSDIMLGITN